MAAIITYLAGWLAAGTLVVAMIRRCSRPTPEPEPETHDLSRHDPNHRQD